MKKILLTLTTAGVLILAGCKKESTNNNTEPPISSKDPVALSKSLKIWHASRITGTAPLPTGGAGAPVVNPPSNDVKAFAGSYAIIKPSVLSGSVAGYYIGIEGAGEYFKLDYSKPRTEGRPKVRTPKNFLHRPMDGSDSSIVVTIPANLQVPDTFCITYCAYDSIGNIGQPVTTCIIVSQLGGDASSSWLNGVWRYSADLDFNNNTTDSVIYNRWTFGESENVSYYCYTDPGGNSSVMLQFGPMSDPAFVPLGVADSVFRFKGDMALGSTGGMNYVDSFVTRNLRIDSSTCSSLVFSSETQVYHTLGGWSLTGDRLTLVYLFDEVGQEEYSAEDYLITRPDNNTLVLRFTDGSNEGVLLKKL